MSLSLMGQSLCARPLHVPLVVLAAPALGVEPHHDAVVVDPVDRPSGTLEVRARPGGPGEVAVHGNGRIRRVVGALVVAGRGALVIALAKPGLDYRIEPGDGLVVRVVAVLDVLGE